MSKSSRTFSYMSDKEQPKNASASTQINVHKPNVTKKKASLDRIGSKTAPIESTFGLELMDSEEENFGDYISSYNYYIYYHSIKPRDPRLPKPTYQVSPDLDFIKGEIEKTIDEKDDLSEKGSCENQANKSQVLEREQNREKKMWGESHIVKAISKIKIEDAPEEKEQLSTHGTEENSVNAVNKVDTPKNGKMKVSAMLQSPLNNISIISPIDKPPEVLLIPHNSLSSNPFFPANFSGGIGCNYSNFPYGNYPPGWDYLGMRPVYYNMGFPTDPYRQVISNVNMNVYKPWTYGDVNMNVNTSAVNTKSSVYSEGECFSTRPGCTGTTVHETINSPSSCTQGGGGNKNSRFSSYSPGSSASLPELKDILPNIIDYCRDHSGSRIVQKKFEESDEEDKNRIMDALKLHVYSLTKDLFGNYVIQIILDHSRNSRRRSSIMQELEGKIPELALHMYGCRVIQKSIEVIEVEHVRAIFREIKNMVHKCIEDQNGNHVIQKLIERLPPEDNIEIIKIVKTRVCIIYEYIIKVFDVTTHQYGCRVIQKLFEYCMESDYMGLLNEIMSKVLMLSQDQYGNYVIQHIVEKQGQNLVYFIWEQLRKKLFDLCIHKYASNIIEKLLAYGNNKIRMEIIDEIIFKDDQYSDLLISMVRDKYGNYVVQKLIEVADQKSKETIVKKIITSQALKKRDGFCIVLLSHIIAKHVINFIEKLGLAYPQCFR